MTIEFSSYSGVFSLKATQNVPLNLSETWLFFSHPENLSKITPAEMNFNITSGAPKDVYAGQIISYKVNVFKNIRMSWITEMTQVQHEKYFIDEQFKIFDKFIEILNPKIIVVSNGTASRYLK